MGHFLKQTKPSDWIGFLSVYFVAVALLIVANLPTIGAATYESGDFAANSLLIQDAKSFSLWIGNYSRVGFNHPGPAILYVLAMGEMVFHDALHWVDFPFAGQLIAVAFYNAFWITLTFIAFYRFTQSKALALAALSAFLLTLALLNYEFFNGIWMPNLYLFPFAVMLVSITRLIDGKTDALQALALSSGFLINGHVSFVAILGIILIFTLIANFLMFRNRAHDGRVILSTTFLAQHRRDLILACLTLLVFFIPLIIMTITHFPGPVMQYATFSGGHKANSIRLAAKYMAFYWGGWTISALAVIAAFGLLKLTSRLPENLATASKAFVLALIGASLGMFFYARYGVDYLDQRYIGFFYYAVPALAVSYALLIVANWFDLASKKPVLLGVSLAALIATFVTINKPVEYAYFFKYSEAPQAYDQLNALRLDSPLVMNLTEGANWAQVWTSVLALQAYADHKGARLFCVNEHWHLSFTEQNRCTQDEVRKGKQLIVTLPDKYPDTKPVLTSLGVSFYQIPEVSTRGYVDVGSAAKDFAVWFLTTGWSHHESDFVWTVGTESHLRLDLAPGSKGTLNLDLQGYVPKPETRQSVSFYLNDAFVTRANFSQQNARQQISLPVDGSLQTLDVKMVIDSPLSPQETGGSDDSRKLGVALYGFKFDGVKP